MSMLLQYFDAWYRKRKAEEIFLWIEDDKDINEILETGTRGFIKDKIESVRVGINEGKKMGSRYGRIGEKIGGFLGAGIILEMQLMPVWVICLIIWLAFTKVQW